jgi:hypothetical protein
MCEKAKKRRALCGPWAACRRPTRALRRHADRDEAQQASFAKAELQGCQENCEGRKQRERADPRRRRRHAERHPTQGLAGEGEAFRGEFPARQARPDARRQRHQLQKRQRGKGAGEQHRKTRLPGSEQPRRPPQGGEQQRQGQELENGIGKKAVPRAPSQQKARYEDEGGQPKQSAARGGHASPISPRSRGSRRAPSGRSFSSRSRISRPSRDRPRRGLSSLTTGSIVFSLTTCLRAAESTRRARGECPHVRARGPRPCASSVLACLPQEAEGWGESGGPCARRA